MEIKPDMLFNGRYQILSPLGKSGLGSVYLALDTNLGRKVAIKATLQGTEKDVSQFMREARLLSRLSHPNLVKVLDYFLIENLQCLVMAYIPGHDLQDVLDKEGPLPLSTVLKWADQLAPALSFLHKQYPPIIHQDVKPSNIKITSKKEIILVGLTIGKLPDNTQPSISNIPGYSSGFTPPEQYHSGRTAPYSDQFALAATLYALLTNQPPVDALQRENGEAMLVPLTTIQPNIPKYIQHTLEKALSVKYEDRYASIEAFCFKLNKSKSDKTVRSIASLNKPIPIKPTRPFSWLPVLLIVIFVAVVLIIGQFFLNPSRNPSANNMVIPSPSIDVSIDNHPTSTLLVSTDTPIQVSTITILPTTLSAVKPSLQPSNDLGGGKMVAFISDRGNGKIHQIWTMKINMNDNAIRASDLTQRTFDNTPKQDPGWSPDGKWLIYAAPGAVGKGLELWKLDINQTDNQPVRLTDMSGDNFQPSWSPDGNKIAFTHVDNHNGGNKIYFINQDGSQVEEVTKIFNENQPVWTPDGRWLLFVNNASNHQFFFMYHLQGNAPNSYPTPQPYDNTEVLGHLGDVANPALSKDGRALAYTRNEGITHRIYRLDFAGHGSNPILLTEGMYKESDPTWSPEADWICFTSERDNNQEIYIMTSTGQLATNLSLSPGIDRQPSWQP